ncbi:MAG: exodeoxyribonuclease III [Lawsonibacter sp.]|jgi:exodeoxyribonuclease-3
MKFISWNVNGLRACLKKGFLDVFQDQAADFFCLQETKMEQGQADLDFGENYLEYWNSAEKKGYSGTAIFTPHRPLQVAFGMDKDIHDHEGRLITLEYETFYLVCCYTPNAQDGLKRLDYRMVWEDDLREYLVSLDQNKPVIYCGDLNVAHQEIDLKNPKTNRLNAGFTDQEREKFSALLASGFTDTFRYLYPDITGAYSWWSYRFQARKNNAGWRIDYFLVSNRLRERIRRAEILSHIPGSDHCPVLLELDLT